MTELGLESNLNGNLRQVRILSEIAAQFHTVRCGSVLMEGNLKLERNGLVSFSRVSFLSSYSKEEGLSHQISTCLAHREFEEKKRIPLIATTRKQQYRNIFSLSWHISDANKTPN